MLHLHILQTEMQTGCKQQIYDTRRHSLCGFSASVRQITEAIPAGSVATYGDVAALAGFPSHARLVGKVLGAIGVDSPVPCHRVVNSQGRTAPHWHSQRRLLESEGVTFLPSGRVDMRRHRWHPDVIK